MNISHNVVWPSLDLIEYATYILADYSKENLKGYGAGLWFWQHNQKGWCEGVKGTVDYNVFLGNEADLDELCL